MKNPINLEEAKLCASTVDTVSTDVRRETLIHLGLLNVNIIQYAISPVPYHAVSHFQLIKLAVQSTGCL